MQLVKYKSNVKFFFLTLSHLVKARQIVEINFLDFFPNNKKLIILNGRLSFQNRIALFASYMILCVFIYYIHSCNN